MKKPIIGITCRYNEETQETSLIPTYMNSVSELGAIPVLLYCTKDEELLEEWVNLCDGILFSGGADVHPSYYGEEKKETCGEPSPSRDWTESRIFSLARKAGKPILGICRGEQLVNVMMGGTLYQDVPTELSEPVIHRVPDRKPAWHSMRIVPGSLLHQIVGVEECTVNSYHHQGVLQVAPGMRAVAFAPDGLIEAIEGTDGPWLLAIQWHPERTFETDSVSHKLFEGFVNACRAAKE